MSREQNCPFFEPSDERKFRIIVEERTLYVYKEMLFAISPVLESLVERDFALFKEDYIELKGKKLDEILELFETLFPVVGICKRIDWENVEKMITFANEYDIEQLKVTIRDFLRLSSEKLSINDDFCIKYANYALQIGACFDVVKRCVPFVCELPPSKFLELPKNVVVAFTDARHNRVLACMHSFSNSVAWCGKCQKTAGSVCYRCQFCPDCGGKWCTAIHNESCRYRHMKWLNDTPPVCCCGYKVDETILNQKAV